MNFYCITSKNDIPREREERTTSLREACDKHNVRFIELEADLFAPGRFEHTTDTNLLYRTSKTALARRLEKYLCSLSFTTLYADDRYCISGRGSGLLSLEHAKLPHIPAFFFVPIKKRDLQECVDALGGFPIAIKVEGYSEGVGVMKVDHMENLVALSQYLRRSGVSFSLKKFILHKSHARLTVVGDEVVSSYENVVMDGEFRSNIRESKKTNFYEKKYSDEIEQLAVAATKATGVEYGGVDVLFGEDGNNYIAEVNFPSDFVYAEKVTGKSVASAIIQHLKQKAQNR